MGHLIAEQISESSEISAQIEQARMFVGRRVSTGPSTWRELLKYIFLKKWSM